MTTSRRLSILAALVVLLFFVSSCSLPGSTSASSQALFQVIQKSAKAMQKLKAVHFDMTLTDSLNSNPGTPTAGSPPLQPFTITVKASGDSVPPDQASTSLTVNTGLQGSQAIKLAEVVIGKQIYIQNSKGKWFLLEINQSAPQGSSIPLSRLNPTNYNKLLGLVQKAKITDHGDENLGGQSLRHFTIAFGKDSLQDFLNATGSLNSSSLQQQQLNSLLKGITLQRASLDAWIDESTSYVHRIALKFVMSINLNAIGGTATPGSSSSAIPPTTTSVETTIDYSKFNVPVTIQAPANATPTSDFLKIFQ